MEVGEKARWRSDYRRVNKIMYSLEGGYGSFQRCVTQVPRNNGQGLLKGNAAAFYLVFTVLLWLSRRMSLFVGNTH